ncbi:unnamed protein product [Durusdinium trenchii]|uniref:Uncharacterized protein n=1 Tax=Durusdinium trenchii TaxID=1381693 RepID=A0ABP0K7K6_9DINO
MIGALAAVGSPPCRCMGMWSGIRRSPQFRAAASGAKPGVRLATSEQIVGFTIKEYKGLVMGSTVRAKDVTKDITSAITAVFGGELPHYTQLMQDAREEAMSRLEDEAVKLGANAVVSLRLSSTNIAASIVILAGTPCYPRFNTRSDWHDTSSLTVILLAVSSHLSCLCDRSHVTFVISHNIPLVA